MINNLVSTIRDNKGTQPIQGSSAEGSEGKKESKKGFGLIFQTLQEKGSNEQEKNQSSVPGQTEVVANETPEDGTEDGKARTESGNRETVIQLDANTLSKAQIETTETLQTPQAEVTQTREGNKIVEQESTLQIVDPDLQKNSGKTVLKGNEKGNGNEGKTLVTIQGKLDISSTDGISNGEMQEVTKTDGQTTEEGKSENGDGKPINRLVVNPEIVKGQANTDGVTSGQDNLTEGVSVTDAGKAINLQEIAHASKVEQTERPISNFKSVEHGKNIVDAEQKITAGNNQGGAVSEMTTGEQKPVSSGSNNTADTSQAETQKDKSAGFKVAASIQIDEKVQTKVSTEFHGNISNELVSTGNKNATSGTGQVKADGLVNPVTGVVENEIPNFKVETPSTEKIGTEAADKSVPATHVRPELKVPQNGTREAGPVIIEQRREMVFANTEPQKLQHATKISETTVSVAQENQEKLVHDILLNKETTYPLENVSVNKKLYADNIREKKYGDRLSNFELRSENSAERGKIPVDWRNSQLWSGKMGTFSNNQFQMSDTISSELKMNDEELLWNKHSVDITQLKENKAAEQQSLGFARLMEIPVFNFSIRRNLLPALTQSVQKAATGNGSLTENWQKHNFTLENGKNLQLSMRQVDGVVFMKLNSTHSELTRLLIQHQDEIRQHLQKECNVEIDLQFEDNGEQDLSQFFDDSSSGKRGWSGKSTITSGKEFVERESQDVQKTIRKFGYNRMEWMA